MQPGATNSIIDVAGLLVGHADDAALKSGVTVLTSDAPFGAAAHIMGGAPGTRDLALLAPDKLVDQVDALVLSGGSAFGLDAAGGVMAGLAAMGRGFAVGPARVPIVPAAIVFDLVNGGAKDWAENPYPQLGRRAFDTASADPRLGSVGAGYGALTGDLKGGLGTASVVLDNGATVAALVVVNALGRATDDRGRFWAAPFEFGDEFGGRGPVLSHDPAQEPTLAKQLGEATTIAIVATDAKLDKGQLARLATAAHDGMARSLLPSHSPLDGDLVFAVSKGQIEVDPIEGAFSLGHAAACVLARAIARGVHAAAPAPGDLQPTWQARFG